MELLNNLDLYLESFLNTLGIWGALMSCFLITIESILPVLPLCVFVTLEFYYFGPIAGFFVSLIFTCIGCLLSFTLCRKFVKKWTDKKIEKFNDKDKILKLIKFIDNITPGSLAMLVAIPFTPASAVNIAAGLSNISVKKFMLSIIVGKVFMVYFWGYVGTTLIESLTHPMYLIKIVFMLLLAYVICRVLSKYLKLD